MDYVLNVGVIGCGRIGRIHAANVAMSSGVRLVAVADSFIESAHNVAAQHSCHATADAGDVIRQPGIDAVIVASPTSSHVPLITQAVDNGVAVLCEKPIDLNIERVQQLAEHLRGSTVPVAIGFNRRFDPHFASAWQRVRAGEVGEIEQIVIVSRDPSPLPRSISPVREGCFATWQSMILIWRDSSCPISCRCLPRAQA